MPLINGVTDPIIVVGTRGGTSATKVQNLNRVTEVLTVTDDDSRNMTLAAEDIKGGINVHTSVTGGGTVTADTAANSHFCSCIWYDHYQRGKYSCNK